jgi:hypothetical protein
MTIASFGDPEREEWDRDREREADLDTPWAPAAIALEAAQHGDYRAALLWAEETCLVEEEFHERPWDIAGNWRSFFEACDLADRIDCFLATIPAGSQGARLARSCRADVTALVILADWYEENGLPASAAEARHLHSLAPRF